MLVRLYLAFSLVLLLEAKSLPMVKLASDSVISQLSLPVSSSNSSVEQDLPTILYMVSLTIESQNMSLVIDTASSWVLLSSPLNSSMCSDEIKSSAFNGESIQGTLCSEILMFDSSHAATSSYLLIDDSSDILTGYDGVLGLGYSKLSEGYLPLVQRLKLDGVIEDARFSMLLSDDDQESFFTIGGKLEEYEDADKLTIKVFTQEGHWLTNVKLIKFNEVSYNIQALGYFDSKLNVISVPSNEFLWLKNEFLKILGCYFSTYIECSCTSGSLDSFPNITLKLDHSHVSIDPKSYFHYDNYDKCTALLTSNSLNYWILGLPIFKGNYMVFDMDKNQIDIYQGIEIDSETNLSTIYIVGIIVLCVIIIVPLCFYIILSKIRGIDAEPSDYNRLT